MTDASRAAALFDPSRLELARLSRGLRKNEMADQLGVSPAAVSQYEHGRARPSPGVLARISLALGYPLEFFTTTGDQTPVANASAAFFRSLRSTRQIERDQAAARAMLLAEVVGVLERKVQFPDVTIPQIGLPIDAARAAVETAAARAREEMEVPPGPVANVVRLLETHGAIVARLHSGGSALDAFSMPLRRPLVVLWADKNDKARSRFDAAHELGHLVCHPDPEAGNRILEQQAHRFASAFLMPADEIVDELPRRLDFTQLIGVKRRWGVSIAALLYRTRELGVMSESTFQRAMRRMSAEGWRRQEPGDLGPAEAPSLLRRAIEMLNTSGGFTVENLAAEARLSTEQVREFTGLPTDARPTVLPDPSDRIGLSESAQSGVH